MASSTIKTIVVKSYNKNILEFTAAAAMNPGDLVTYSGSGRVTKHNATATNLEVGPVMVVVEDETRGQDRDDAYAANAKVRVWIPGRGDEGLLRVGTGVNLDIGSPLESAENGLVALTTAAKMGTGSLLVGYSLEDKTTTATEYTHVRFA